MQFGDYRVSVIPDTEFRLDGGAMFGVVPRVLWERVSPPDELNRIRLNMNCVVIQTPTERILIETGIGEKWTEKQTQMFGIYRQKPFAQSLFEITGLRPKDITIVINTHLHFDHSGGNTVSEPPAVSGGLTSSGNTVDAASSVPYRAIPQFPNATYLVSKFEYEHSLYPHERDRASYLPENWQPLVEAGHLKLMPRIYEPVPGLVIEQVRGHSETMQTWRLTRHGRTLYGFADLIPTRHHLQSAWIMGYDLYPTETLAFKKQILPQALREDWLCLFYHDPDYPVCRLRESGGKITALHAADD